MVYGYVKIMLNRITSSQFGHLLLYTINYILNQKVNKVETFEEILKK